MKTTYFIILLTFLFELIVAQIPPVSPRTGLLNEPVDISGDYRDFANTYYLADSLASFHPENGKGTLIYRRNEYSTRMAFNNMLGILSPVEANEFPGTEYEVSPSLPFRIDFVAPGTIRIRTWSAESIIEEKSSLMLGEGTPPVDESWKYEKIEGGHRYVNDFGSIIIREYPWRIELYDDEGKLLTNTVHQVDNNKTFTPLLPFSFVRRSSDYSRSYAASFSLQPGEKIFGCGESFSEFNKRGNKVVLFTDDANGTQNESTYKPVPFFLSSRGYGMFMHTSSPITCDFGKYFSGVNTLMIGDQDLDIFVFLGGPKKVLDAYTDLTGKASMPPLWSFGFWMSRITYFSEEEGREIARLLRKNRIPSDVIHFDTGWFGTDWRCDYRFAPDRFNDPKKMISDLKKDGFHVSLWQLPYFVPRNELFPEIIEKGLYVKDNKGKLPTEDAVLDFSNPEAVDWYQDKIAGLLKLGVGAIKVDFGEGAPFNGLYHSGRTGFYEHNLYPLRYNKAVADITREINNENIIWARSTWAGSQRYPVHWGGDPANTNTAMAGTLRAGLSIGLSGFSFWAHDIGGFVQSAPEDLYRRWAAFGMLTSHTRSHGAPPTEPWEYNEETLNEFRAATEMRYRLMPYIYAQAKDCSDKGLPMVRALFIEFPDDPGSWLIDDQYLFGSDILVAPLFENRQERQVYLPPGTWIDYQDGKVYEGGWHKIKSVNIPVIMLVKEGTVIPHAKLAQSTMKMDWSKIELVVYASNSKESKGHVCLPENNQLYPLIVKHEDNTYSLSDNPLLGQTKFSVRHYKE